MAGYLWWPLRNNCWLLYVRPASPEKTRSLFTSNNESDSYNVTKTSKTLDKIFFFKSQLPVVHFLFYCPCWNTVGHSVFTVCELVQFLQQSYCVAGSLGPCSLVCWSASSLWCLLRAPALLVSGLEIHLWTIPSGKWEASLASIGFEHCANGLQGPACLPNEAMVLSLGPFHDCILFYGQC